MLKATILLALAAVASAMNPEVHEKYMTLPKDEFVEYFNSQNFTFKIRHHAHLEGMQLGGVKMENISHIMKMKPKRNQYLPDQFDARPVWPECRTISEIYHQGDCGSCWAFGTATVMSDRTCIHRGVEAALSETEFVCISDNICNGGSILSAFNYWVNFGFVTLNCLPYDAIALRDRKVKCTRKCKDNTRDYGRDKHFGDSVYTLDANDYDVRSDIVMNGPIQASFNVFDDFKDYKTGVYKHTYGELKARHSVRIIGFGTEGGMRYWLVANSWGKNWGDKGYVKIERFSKDLGFESNLMSGLPYN